MLVFISHSTQPDAPRDKEYLDVLVAALEQEFKVLLDRSSLEGSQEWPREIDAYMAECHAAVMLFSSNALTSKWVNKEAAVLNWRRSLSSEFLLLPVALEGVSAKEVCKNERFAAMDLHRWEFVDSGTPAEVASQILKLCRQHAPAKNSTPMERLIIKLTGMLEGAQRALLEAAAHDLGIKTEGWGIRGHEELAKNLARRLAMAGLGDLHPLVRAVAPVIGETQTRKLIQCIKPLWVEAEAAGKIPPVAANRNERKLIGINGDKLCNFTADSYLDRAYWGDVIHKLIRVDAAIGQLAFEEVVTQIEKYFTDKGFEQKELEYYLKETQSLYFVLMPPHIPEVDLLVKLQDRFPRLTFLFPTGKEGHDDPRVKSTPGLVPLEPILNPETERMAWRLHMDLKLILENLSR